MELGCTSILDCLECVSFIPTCFYVDTGTPNQPQWKCVASTSGMVGVRFTVSNKTREFCPTTRGVTIVDGSSNTVGMLALCLAIFCLIGLVLLVFWIYPKKQRTSPRPHSRAANALRDLSSFARRREEERLASREAFNRRNASFQMELASRLEQVRIGRLLHNTPEPPSRQQTPAPPTQPQLLPERPPPQQEPPVPPRRSRTRTPAPPVPFIYESREPSPFPHRAETPHPREITPAPPAIDYGSRQPSPFLHRGGTPQPRELTPPTPPIVAPESIHDSPGSTIYQSIENSPERPATPNPPLQNRSRFGRLLRRTSFFRIVW